MNKSRRQAFLGSAVSHHKESVFRQFAISNLDNIKLFDYTVLVESSLGGNSIDALILAEAIPVTFKSRTYFAGCDGKDNLLVVFDALIKYKPQLNKTIIAVADRDLGQTQTALPIFFTPGCEIENSLFVGDSFNKVLVQICNEGAVDLFLGNFKRDLNFLCSFSAVNVMLVAESTRAKLITNNDAGFRSLQELYQEYLDLEFDVVDNLHTASGLIEKTAVELNDELEEIQNALRELDFDTLNAKIRGKYLILAICRNIYSARTETKVEVWNKSCPHPHEKSEIYTFVLRKLLEAAKSVDNGLFVNQFILFTNRF